MSSSGGRGGRGGGRGGRRRGGGGSGSNRSNSSGRVVTVSEDGGGSGRNLKKKKSSKSGKSSSGFHQGRICPRERNRWRRRQRKKTEKLPGVVGSCSEPWRQLRKGQPEKGRHGKINQLLSTAAIASAVFASAVFASAAAAAAATRCTTSIPSQRLFGPQIFDGKLLGRSHGR